ncbi:MAG: carboxypeptidase-like regulatory domain-containing protein [Reichenbachiella sp.]
MKYRFILILSLLLSGTGYQALAQDTVNGKKIIQFTGIVLDTESEQGVPGVHIYAPKGGRGTTSNPYGYFSMAVLEGDSLIISAISFEKENFIIPTLPEDKYNFTVVISLKRDTTYLEELEVYPFPSEDLLKEAILAFQLPSQYNNTQRTLDQQMLNRMYRNLSMDGNNNYQYYMSQQAQAYNLKYQVNSISLLNPFAWNQFIKSLKKDK